MVYVIFGVRVTTLRKPCLKLLDFYSDPNYPITPTPTIKRPDIWGQSNHSPQALFRALGFLLRPQLSIWGQSDIWGQSNHSPQALFKALGFLLRPQLSTPTPTIHPNYHHLGSPQKAKDIASKTVFPGKVLFTGMKRFSDFFHNTSLYITKEGIVAQTHKLFHGCDQ